MEAYWPCIFTPNCVSSATSAGGTFISSSSAGNDSGEEGFGVVRRVLKRRLHQRLLQLRTPDLRLSQLSRVLENKM